MHPCSLKLDKNLSQTLFIVFLSSESDGFPNAYFYDLYLFNLYIIDIV